MKNYTKGITEEVLDSNNIDKLQVIGEYDNLTPRMIVKYKNDTEVIIDGDEGITNFIIDLMT